MFRAEDRWMSILSWCHAVLIFSGFYLLVAGIFVSGEREAIVIWLNSLWLFVPVISSWFFIRKMKGFIGYLLASAAVVIVIVFLSGNILTFIFSILIFIIRAYVRIIQGKMNNPDLPGQVKEVELWEIPTILDIPKIYHWTVFVVLYFGIIGLKQNHLLKWMFLLLLVEIFITYIHSSLYQMKNYVVDNCHIAHLPIKVMQRMQRAVLGITIVMLIAFVLPSVFYGKEPLTALADLSLDLNINLEEETMQNMPVMPDPGKAMQEMFGVEQREPNVILEKIMDILIYVIMVFAGMGMIYAVWQVCRKMMNSFEKGQETDEIISLDSAEESRAVKFYRKRVQAGRKSVGQRIRKQYKKIIRKNMKDRSQGNPMGWETPEELEVKAGFQSDETIKRIHDLYEKARYSNKICDEKDMEIFLDFKKK